MGTINIVGADEANWVSAEEMARRRGLSVPNVEIAGQVRNLQQGTADRPDLYETTFPPNFHVAPHAHDCAEIIYVTRGAMHMGSRVLPAGSSISIDANTLYSFRSGPDGLTFLNFRPHGGSGYITQEAFLAARGKD